MAALEEANTSDREFKVLGDLGLPPFGLLVRNHLDSDEYRTLNLTEIKVWNVLLTFAGRKTGEAWPKQATIARIAGCRREHVSRSMRKLIECGFVETTARGRLTIYILKPPYSRRRRR